MAFAGRSALVVGGAGNVGSGVVQELLKQGAKVVVVSRSQEKFQQLKAKVPESARARLSLIEANVNTEEGTKKIFDTVTKQEGGLQHVVASIGGYWAKGKLVDQSLAEFNDRIKEAVTGHFLLFKYLAPYLETQPGSTYTILTGNAGDQYVAPNTSLLSMASGALNGMAVAARAEHKDGQLAVSEFKIHCWVHPKLDSEMQKDDVHLGHDLAGQAIVGTMKIRSRDQNNIHNRKDAQKFAKS